MLVNILIRSSGLTEPSALQYKSSDTLNIPAQRGRDCANIIFPDSASVQHHALLTTQKTNNFSSSLAAEFSEDLRGCEVFPAQHIVWVHSQSRLHSNYTGF